MKYISRPEIPTKFRQPSLPKYCLSALAIPLAIVLGRVAGVNRKYHLGFVERVSILDALAEAVVPTAIYLVLAIIVYYIKCRRAQKAYAEWLQEQKSRRLSRKANQKLKRKK